MKYTIAEINLQNTEYISNLPTFECALQCVQSGLEPKDTHALETWLRRKHIDFLMCTSTTSTQSFNQIIVHRTGKRGRPKTEHRGAKASPHCHIIIVSDSTNHAEEVKKDLLTYLKKRRKKHTNLKQPQSSYITSSTELVRYIRYSSGQSDNNFTGGEYDFDYFKETPPFL